MRQSFVVLEASSHTPCRFVSGLADGRLRISGYRRPTAEQPPAADALQPTLRSGFRARLRRGVRRLEQQSLL